jgi:hypothetical protein
MSCTAMCTSKAPTISILESSPDQEVPWQRKKLCADRGRYWPTATLKAFAEYSCASGQIFTGQPVRTAYDQHIMSRHKRQVARPKEAIKPSKPDVRTLEQLASAREAGRAVTGQRDARQHHSTPSAHRRENWFCSFGDRKRVRLPRTPISKV